MDATPFMRPEEHPSRPRYRHSPSRATAIIGCTAALQLQPLKAYICFLKVVCFRESGIN